ncbi:hypothetical protein EMIT043CA1_210103 [Pseudomonas brassicacearum]
MGARLARDGGTAVYSKAALSFIAGKPCSHKGSLPQRFTPTKVHSHKGSLPQRFTPTEVHSHRGTVSV